MTKDEGRMLGATIRETRRCDGGVCVGARHSRTVDDGERPITEDGGRRTKDECWAQ
jgi:hypothetical protein